ncbi:hypothetical protein GO495_11535 [Chitinophaga oryziterrae]|uniref:Uncharacterized protein n=1 Tax=Chitinophaga oryziterrae TaxID=1031224 RepID=A0A6N8JA70_9BACT|nr:hypothetical protein [Chitinophaga oryziterrae]MVT41216.1 hypothetical protein [Chitinophaga oryziterrae]
MENIKLAKAIWTEEDFDAMGWHDSYIYSISFGINYELILDIDYTFELVQPTEANGYFKFWVSPCTLVFENVNDLKLDVEISAPFELQISDITRSNPRRPINTEYIKRETEYHWTIATQQGDIALKSVGYKQYVRQQPVLQDSPLIGFIERGKTSFDRATSLIV